MSRRLGMVDFVQSVETHHDPHSAPADGDVAVAAETKFRLRKGKTFKIPRDRNLEIHTKIVQSRKDKQVYVEAQEGSDLASRILVPQVRQVAEVRPGLFSADVRMKGSPLRLVLARQRFRFVNLLKSSEQQKKKLLITNDPDTHEILDVRPSYESVSRESLMEPAPEAAELLSLKRATEVFNFLAHKCDIPFDYPDEYCNARAHEMFRRLRGLGIACKKVWSFGGDGKRMDSAIRVFTPHHPDGVVGWLFHVAVLIKVKLPSPFKPVVDMVLDPALVDRPIRLPDWLALQHDSTAVCEKTRPEFYDQDPGDDDHPMYDNDFKETDYWLGQARIAAEQRKIELAKWGFEEPPA